MEESIRTSKGYIYCTLVSPWGKKCHNRRDQFNTIPLVTTINSKVEKLNDVYQCCAAQYNHKNHKIFKPTVVNNSVAGFSEVPPSSAWKLGDIHCTTWETLNTT